MESNIGIAIAIIVLAIAWNLRRAFFNQSDVWKEKVDLATKENKVDLQEDYKTLHARVEEVRAKNGDKWFKMSDIEDLMK